jgi:hypothetical protein
MTTTDTPGTHPEPADTVTQTVTLACGHRRRYHLSRTVAESGFAAPGIAWFCDTCDPTHHTRRPIVTVHNTPNTAATRDR